MDHENPKSVPSLTASGLHLDAQVLSSCHSMVLSTTCVVGGVKPCEKYSSLNQPFQILSKIEIV